MRSDWQWLFQVLHLALVMAWLAPIPFNLLIIFPVQAAGARDHRDLLGRLSAQGMKVAPWLYGLIAATALSGLALAVSQRGAEGPALLGDPLLLGKAAATAAMLALHLFGSLYVWPRLMLGSAAGFGRWFGLYRLSIGLVYAIGFAVMAVSVHRAHFHP